MYLKHLMRENLDYFVRKADAPIAKAIIILARRYPDPLRGTVLHPNSLRLLDIKDEFFKHWDTGDRLPVFQALFKLLIVKYEQSPPYRNMLDWFLMMIPFDWKPFNYNRQMRCWKGDNSEKLQ